MTEQQKKLKPKSLSPHNFVNPVIKKTFKALPKIYGKKVKRQYVFKFKQNLKGLDRQNSAQPLDKCKEADGNGNAKQQQQLGKVRQFKRIKFNMQLANPKINICGKIKCACHEHQHNGNDEKEREKKRVVRDETSRWRNISVDGQDQLAETKHKIFKPQYKFHIQAGLSISKRYNIDQQSSRQIIPTDVISNPLIKIHRKCRSLNVADHYKLNTIKTSQDKHKNKPKVSKLNHQFSSSPYYKYIENYKSQKNQTLSNEILIQTNSVLDLDKSQNDTFSISSSALKNDLKSNTIFQHHNNKLNSKLRIKAFSDQLNNHNNSFNTTSVNNGGGVVFQIPEQEEISAYMMKYKPMDSSTNLKELIKKANFLIFRDSKQLFFGQVVDNKKHGFGINVTSKQIFQGLYQGNCKIFGAQKRGDGVYIGPFLNGKRHGNGKYIWNNGQLFEGEWRDGKKNGKGTWKSPNGDFYQGLWKDNSQNGHGQYLHASCSKYRGPFKNFLKHGQGTEEFLNGDHYIGNYENGRPHGKGKYIWKNGDVYEGDFTNGQRQGHGMLYKSNGQIYNGRFENEEKSGHGKQTYISGESFEGTFKNNERYEGILKTKDGIQIQITPL